MKYLTILLVLAGLLATSCTLKKIPDCKTVPLQSISEPNPIPDAVKLHPELFTVQFTLAELKEDFQIESLRSTNSPSLPSAMPPKIKGRFGDFLMPEPQEIGTFISTDDQKEKIRKSNPSYTNFATMYISPDKVLSGKNEAVKVSLLSEFNALDIIHLTLPDYRTIYDYTIGMKPDEWYGLAFGGKNIDGKEKKYFMFIKLYEPQK